MCSGTSILFLSFFIFCWLNLKIIPKIAPNAIPERCAMCPVLSGMKIPTASMIIQITAATAIGTIMPNAHTIIVGRIIAKAPIIPIIAPDAPKDEG